MQLDGKAVLTSVLQRGSLLHFAPNTYFGSSTWHYAVVVNSNPANDGAVIVACITSKYPRRKYVAQVQGLPESTVVELPVGAHPKFDSGTSGIDCNHAKRIPIDDLAYHFGTNQLKLVRNNGDLDARVVDLVAQGILDSPIVAANVQALVSL